VRADPFTIEEHSEEGSYTLILRGQLDMAGAPALEGMSQQLCEAGAQEVVLDLSQLEFIDSSGLKAILECNAMFEEHRCDLTLVPGSPSVHRVFELTRLVDRLPFRRTGVAQRSGRSQPLEGYAARLPSNRSSSTR
jgi:anti-anti-sigma factor